MGVAKVGRMRRSEVDGRLVDRVGDLVREDASRQARDDFFDLPGPLSASALEAAADNDRN